MTTFETSLEERLVRYCRVDSQSDEKSASSPSTAIQLNMQNMLKAELEKMGASEINLTAKGVLYATIPSTAKNAMPTIGLLAHVDTAPAFHAAGVKPIVHRNYNGSDIVLPDDTSKVISPKQFPYLAKKVGHTVITASGTTLLGADDKAGVAVIMTMAEHLLAHPEIAHGKVRICFTPDEEIGTGIRNVTKEDLSADFAYTLDGGGVGEFDIETFSADKATISIEGVSIHTGTAYKEMVNALNLAAKIIDALPAHTRTPETTKDREGF
ncbi:MAG TPA: peptidase T, partial [Thermoflexales bacterium]|nr:peptidase T [Thermoflexales bacterium]